MTEKSHLEDEIKMLQATKSDEETDVEIEELKNVQISNVDDGDGGFGELADHAFVSKPIESKLTKRYRTAETYFHDIQITMHSIMYLLLPHTSLMQPFMHISPTRL